MFGSRGSITYVSTSGTTASTSTVPSSTTTAASAGGLITPAVESEVVATSWKTFSDAFVEDDPVTMATVATPDVVNVVAGYFSCGCEPWPPADTSVSFSAPLESSYPLSFYSEIIGKEYDGTPLNKDVVFTQAAPSAPWLVSYIGASVGPPLFGSVPTNLQQAPMTVPEEPTNLPQEFVSFFQKLDQAGTVPQLPTGALDVGILKEIIDQSQAATYDRSREHLSDQYTHSISGVTAVYPGPDGDLICLTNNVTDVVTPQSGATITQPANRSKWGNLLAPGMYSGLTTRSISDVCLYEDVGGAVAVVSTVGGEYSVIPTAGSSAPSATGAITTVEPAVPPASAAPPATPSVVTGQPSEGESIVISVNPGANTVALDTNQIDVTYKACSSFQAVSPSGARVGLAGVHVGDFVTDVVDISAPCISAVRVLVAPQPPRCEATNYGGQISVIWVGSNEIAHSVVYQRTGSDQATVGLLWCQPPTIVGANGSATTLAQIRAGSTVEISMSGNVWVTGIQLQS